MLDDPPSDTPIPRVLLPTEACFFYRGNPLYKGHVAPSMLNFREWQPGDTPEGNLFLWQMYEVVDKLNSMFSVVVPRPQLSMISVSINEQIVGKMILARDNSFGGVHAAYDRPYRLENHEYWPQLWFEQDTDAINFRLMLEQ